MFSWLRTGSRVAKAEEHQAAMREKIDSVAARAEELVNSVAQLAKYESETVKALREEIEALKAENAALKARLGEA
jgi:outer membrane murein-binding lipoprotein Lpp